MASIDNEALSNEHDSRPTERDIISVLRRAHERYGIDLNVKQLCDQTLAVHGYTPVDPPLTPPVEEWIYERMLTQGYAGYNYGVFVTAPDGSLGFAKVHYGPDNVVEAIDDNGQTTDSKVGGPQREAAVLNTLLTHGYKAPSVLDYYPASSEESADTASKTYELLVIEAVPPEYGSVRKREDWTPTLARKAAQAITSFATPAELVELFQGETIPLPVENLVAKLPTEPSVFNDVVATALRNYHYIDQPVIVHGDTWFNNIIARHDDEDLMFVDWELASPGYRGQDAGRKLWDLTLTSDWAFSEYTESAEAFRDEWCATDEEMHSLAFGVVYEALRWISDRTDSIEDPATDEASRVSLAQEIKDVQSHALMLLENLQRGR